MSEDGLDDESFCFTFDQRPLGLSLKRIAFDGNIYCSNVSASVCPCSELRVGDLILGIDTHEIDPSIGIDGDDWSELTRLLKDQKSPLFLHWRRSTSFLEYEGLVTAKDVSEEFTEISPSTPISLDKESESTQILNNVDDINHNKDTHRVAGMEEQPDGENLERLEAADDDALGPLGVGEMMPPDLLEMHHASMIELAKLSAQLTFKDSKVQRDFERINSDLAATASQASVKSKLICPPAAALSLAAATASETGGSGSGSGSGGIHTASLFQSGRYLVKHGDLKLPLVKKSITSLFQTQSKSQGILCTDCFLLVSVEKAPRKGKHSAAAGSAGERGEVLVAEMVLDLRVVQLNGGDGGAHYLPEWVSTGGVLSDDSRARSKSGNVLHFQLLFPGGQLDLHADKAAERRDWMQALLAALHGVVDPSLRELGWQHQRLLGTVHAAVIARDEARLRDIVKACDDGDLDPIVLDGQDAFGFTPLHYACILRLDTVARLLHEAGCDVTIPDREGMNVLHWAALQLDAPILERLCENIFDADMPDNQGRTPLYLACVEGRDVFGKANEELILACVQPLLALGADPAHIDGLGLSPEHFAAASWNYDVLTTLLGGEDGPVRTQGGAGAGEASLGGGVECNQAGEGAKCASPSPTRMPNIPDFALEGGATGLSYDPDPGSSSCFHHIDRAWTVLHFACNAQPLRQHTGLAHRRLSEHESVEQSLPAHGGAASSDSRRALLARFSTQGQGTARRCSVQLELNALNIQGEAGAETEAGVGAAAALTVGHSQSEGSGSEGEIAINNPREGDAAADAAADAAEFSPEAAVLAQSSPDADAHEKQAAEHRGATDPSSSAGDAAAASTSGLNAPPAAEKGVRKRGSVSRLLDSINIPDTPDAMSAFGDTNCWSTVTPRVSVVSLKIKREEVSESASIRTVRLLLARGLPPNKRDSQGRAPLALVAQGAEKYGQALGPVVALLLSHGARLDDSGSGSSDRDSDLLNGMAIISLLALEQPDIEEFIQEARSEWQKKAPLDSTPLGLYLGCWARGALALTEHSPGTGAPGGPGGAFSQTQSSEVSASTRDSETCDASTSSTGDGCHLCDCSFSLFRRQHTCRLCRAICCDECSRKRVHVDQQGNQRVCDSCFNVAFSLWRAEERRAMASGGLSVFRNLDVARSQSPVPSSNPGGSQDMVDSAVWSSDGFAHAGAGASPDRAFSADSVRTAAATGSSLGDGSSFPGRPNNETNKDKNDQQKKTLFGSFFGIGSGRSPPPSQDKDKDGRGAGGEGVGGRGRAAEAAEAASAKTHSTMAAMNETKAALEQRGERLRDAADKAQKLALAANEFSDMAKQLKKKNSGWW